MSYVKLSQSHRVNTSLLQQIHPCFLTTANLLVVSFAFYQEEGASCSKETLRVSGVLGQE